MIHTATNTGRLLTAGVLWCGLSASCGKDILTRIPVKTDEFTQNSAAKVDALWVVDNSESMGEEQTSLGQSFESFITTLVQTQVEYHIGVISTDPADGGRLHAASGQPRYIDATTPSAAAAFLANVRVGTVGSRLEKAFETTAAALGRGLSWQPGDAPNVPAENAGFFRDDAALFVIMVSDEDDKSFGPVTYYRRLFESSRGAGNESLVSVSAIVGDPSDAPDGGGCYDGARGNALPGDRYIDLATQTDGIYASLCSDFNESLAELSITAAGLDAVFELSTQPDLAAILICGTLGAQPLCVRVDGTPVPEAQGGDRRQGWRFEPSFGVAGAVVFLGASIPKAQSQVTVEYQEQP